MIGWCMQVGSFLGDQQCVEEGAVLITASIRTKLMGDLDHDGSRWVPEKQSALLSPKLLLVASHTR